MKQNMGTLDRGLRAVFGLVLLWFAYFSGAALADPALVKGILTVVAAVMLVTAAVRICPLYGLIGLKTCKEH